MGCVAFWFCRFEERERERDASVRFELDARGVGVEKEEEMRTNRIPQSGRKPTKREKV